MKKLSDKDIVCDGKHRWYREEIEYLTRKLKELTAIHEELWKNYEGLKYDSIYNEAFDDGWQACLRARKNEIPLPSQPL